MRLITTLDYCGHFCLVFELLDPKPLSIPVRIEQQQQHLMATTVNDPTIVRRHMERIKSKTVRKLAHQLVVALAFLRRHRLIHADLKPENLLFRADERVCGIDTASGNESDFLETASSSASTSFHVKLIDFGNAFTVEQAAVYFETFDVQSLHYRAPEVGRSCTFSCGLSFINPLPQVLVGIPFDAAIDMWSLGIILCEAWMGRHMFHSDAPGSLMRELIQLMGSLPRDVFHSGKNFYEHYCDGSLVVASEAARFDLTSEEEYAMDVAWMRILFVSLTFFVFSLVQSPQVPSMSIIRDAEHARHGVSPLSTRRAGV